MTMNASHIMFCTENTELSRLWEEAVRGCKGNLRLFGDDRVLVEGGGYNKIWLETQPMGGAMYAHHDMEAALNNQLLFMRHQRADGRLPGSIMVEGNVVTPQFNKLQGFCFAEPALDMYYLIGKDADYLHQLANTLRRFDAWLWNTRDSNGDGVLESFCVYDTGEDNAVRYGDAPCWWTGDAPPEDSRVVPMASMDVTSYSYSCRRTLAQIARIEGSEAEETYWLQKAQDVAKVLQDKLWNEERGALFDRDKHGCPIDVLCHNTLRCMYWGSVSHRMADRFVRDHLLNPKEFYTRLPLPSVSVHDAAFRNVKENNWSGQCEGLTYQRAIRALENYGYEPLVTDLGRKLLGAIVAGGYAFTQQFDPFTAQPSRVAEVAQQGQARAVDTPMQHAYGPTMLAAMAYMERMWGVRVARDEVWFSFGSGLAYEYELSWQNCVFRMESDGCKSQAVIQTPRGRKTLSSSALGGGMGFRVMTDLEGNILRTRVIEKPHLP